MLAYCRRPAPGDALATTHQTLGGLDPEQLPDRLAGRLLVEHHARFDERPSTSFTGRHARERPPCRPQVAAWEEERNERLVEVTWRLATADARIKPHRPDPSVHV